LNQSIEIWIEPIHWQLIKLADLSEIELGVTWGNPVTQQSVLAMFEIAEGLPEKCSLKMSGKNDCWFHAHVRTT
jgi:hypothetical protein